MKKMSKVYILTFDKGNLFDRFDYTQFHKSLINANGIDAWWHYLEGTYLLIVSSNVNSTSLSNYIRKIMPNKLFFVCRVDLNDYNGWLPQKAWTWIQGVVKTKG